MTSELPKSPLEGTADKQIQQVLRQLAEKIGTDSDGLTEMLRKVGEGDEGEPLLERIVSLLPGETGLSTSHVDSALQFELDGMPKEFLELIGVENLKANDSRIAAALVKMVTDENGAIGQVLAGKRAPRGVKTIRHEGSRAGRNDPCPYGSGTKHKKCCWGKDTKSES